MNRLVVMSLGELGIEPDSFSELAEMAEEKGFVFRSRNLVKQALALTVDEPEQAGFFLDSLASQNLMNTDGVVARTPWGFEVLSDPATADFPSDPRSVFVFEKDEIQGKGPAPWLH